MLLLASSYLKLRSKKRIPLNRTSLNFLEDGSILSSKKKTSGKNIYDDVLYEDIRITEESKLNGFVKLWLYQLYALSHLSWPLIFNDLKYKYSQELERSIKLNLKV